MPLRRLELFNFKSYRGTQVINLGEAPFTCIIGPNGSGKSNLMDAISFVLGVKSAQLRSTQLKDLIYRGRKAAEGVVEDIGLDVEIPDTQESPDAQIASVTAVYEDDGGKVWTFKRTISLAGSSNYHLNSKSVTWNVYNQQLEKFNILVKAKNFLVFQGDVEGVASQDSKALAKLIDRISGSLDLAQRYEAAKLSQEKATEAANSHNAKKRGLLTEYKHFKEQTAEVKDWEKRRDERDALIQRHLLWRLYHITEEINESTRQVEEATEQLHELRNAVTESDNHLREARKEQGQAQLAVKKREATVKRAEKAVEDKKPDLVAMEAQIAHSEKKVRSTAALFERVDKDRTRQTESLEVLEEGASEVRQRMEEAREKLRKKSQESGKALSEGDLREYRQLRAAANLLAVEERQQLETVRREQKGLRDLLVSINDRLDQAERKRAKLDTEITTLTEREETTSARVTEMEEEKKNTKVQIDQIQDERKRIDIRQTELNERLQEIINKLLQAGADKRESQREIKLKETLSNMRSVFRGVRGRVVDLCKPTAGKYDTAVMTVLGRFTDAIVVDHEQTAIECIEYMRQQRAGLATFIPLDTIQVMSVPEKLRNFTRGARLAIDCIEFDPQVERAMQHVCGSAMICDTMDVARYICWEKKQEVKAVVLDGTVLHKSGLMTGGRGESGRKFTDRDVDTLRQQREKLTQQLVEAGKSRPKDKADESLIHQLQRVNMELGTATDDLAATRLRLQSLRQELAATDRDIRKMRPDKEKRSSALADADASVSELAGTIDEAEAAVFAAFCQKIKVTNIKEYEDVQLRAAQDEEAAMESYAQENSRISHRIDFEKAQLRSTTERLAELQSQINRETRNGQNLEGNKAELEQEIQEMEVEIERQQGKLETTKAALEEASGGVDEMRTAARKTQRALDNALKEISGWNDEIERSSSDRHAIYRKCQLEGIDLPIVSGSLDKVPIDETAKEMEMDLDVDDDYLRPVKTDDFGIEPDFDMLEEEDKENSTPEVGKEFEAQIAKMKADIERVIPNMKAIDRLAEVQNSLKEAEDEAEEARRESKRARDEFLELKKKRVELFYKAFKHMSGCIDQIYKDLTKNSVVPTGGMAFLSLEDDQEPYLGGVKYNTMPPGKRFVEIEQLSGGEKTMAALALLFSIHSFHPAPFFVLDEVDAALDPTNVSKLARYIREQAENHVQFLIISLKSTLYEHADSLVGVYREQEENSSETLSMNLQAYA